MAGAAFATAGFLAATLPTPSIAANECRIKYSWNTGNILSGNFQNHSTTKYLDAGETVSIDKNRMNYVRNMQTPQVKFFLDNAQDVTLGKDQQNPVAGNYVGTVKLTQAKCLASTGGGSSGGSSSGGSSSSGSSSGGTKDCLGSFPDVAKTPGPAGPVPIPYPNIKKC
jgi:uncharacterized membrane protein YgcG